TQRARAQVGALLLGRANRHARLARGDVELLLVASQRDASFWIELHEFAKALGHPNRAQPNRSGYPEITGWLSRGVGEQRLYGLQLVHHLAGRAVKHFALLGEHQSPCVTVKERNAKLSLERGNLTAHRRLTHAEEFASVRETARFSCGMKDS